MPQQRWVPYLWWSSVVVALGGAVVLRAFLARPTPAGHAFVEIRIIGADAAALTAGFVVPAALAALLLGFAIITVARRVRHGRGPGHAVAAH